MFLPARQRGEVAPSYGDGGVMGHNTTVAHDPSAPAGHLPGFAREERSRRHRQCRTGRDYLLLLALARLQQILLVGADVGSRFLDRRGAVERHGDLSVALVPQSRDPDIQRSRLGLLFPQA